MSKRRIDQMDDSATPFKNGAYTLPDAPKKQKPSNDARHHGLAPRRLFSDELSESSTEMLEPEEMLEICFKQLEVAVKGNHGFLEILKKENNLANFVDKVNGYLDEADKINLGDYLSESGILYIAVAADNYGAFSHFSRKYRIDAEKKPEGFAIAVSPCEYMTRTGRWDMLNKYLKESEANGKHRLEKTEALGAQAYAATEAGRNVLLEGADNDLPDALQHAFNAIGMSAESGGLHEYYGIFERGYQKIIREARVRGDNNTEKRAKSFLEIVKERHKTHVELCRLEQEEKSNTVPRWNQL